VIFRGSALAFVIARSTCDEAIQPRLRPLDCFASLAMTGKVFVA